MRKGLQIVVLLSLVNMLGCAGIEPPTPKEILKHPFGMVPIKVGMTKDQVREELGEPDAIQDEGGSQDKGLTERQEWTYYSRVKNIPVNYGYFSKSLRLHFDGDNLTSFREE
ncbi:MAG: outer membrane protein assembly factor BamE [Candidatus Omnitrophica bacterium]|nr:outer membrane protein assembly factor BamE [Candidatus Omnitrophota bacterium]